MAKMTFQQAAAPAAPLFDVNAAVADFYTAHPDLAEKVFFIDAAAASVAHPDPAMMQELVRFITQSEPGKTHVQPAIAGCATHKSSYCLPNGPEGGFIILYSGADALRLTHGHSHATELQFVFDHETAHAIIEDGRSDNRFLAENIADAYATVRHLQRTGGNTRFIEDMMLARARDTVFRENGILNFSSPVLEKILDDAKTVPFEKFSHAQTVAYVTAMARQYTPDGPALRSLHENLAALKGRPRLNDLHKIVATSEDAHVLHWGRKVMSALATQRIPRPENLRRPFKKAATRPQKTCLHRHVRPRKAAAPQRMSA